MTDSEDILITVNPPAQTPLSSNMQTPPSSATYPAVGREANKGNWIPILTVIGAALVLIIIVSALIILRGRRK